MEYLRRVIKKTIRDKIRNKMIRMNFGTQPLQNKMEQAQLRWFGHLEWMKKIDESDVGSKNRRTRNETTQRKAMQNME
jgi:hypothetical protein